MIMFTLIAIVLSNVNDCRICESLNAHFKTLPKLSEKPFRRSNNSTLFVSSLGANSWSFVTVCEPLLVEQKFRLHIAAAAICSHFDCIYQRSPLLLILTTAGHTKRLTSKSLWWEKIFFSWTFYHRIWLIALATLSWI